MLIVFRPHETTVAVSTSTFGLLMTRTVRSIRRHLGTAFVTCHITRPSRYASSHVPVGGRCNLTDSSSLLTGETLSSNCVSRVFAFLNDTGHEELDMFGSRRNIVGRTCGKEQMTDRQRPVRDTFGVSTVS
jgi:hypothetical protein